MTPIERRVAAPRISGIVTSQRSGWVDRSPRQGIPQMNQRASVDRPPQERRLEIICHKRFEQNHYAPDCVLSLRYQRRVILNYEQFTPTEKMSVPTSSYHRVCAILGAKDDEDKPYQLASHSTTPYPGGSKYRDPIYAQRAEPKLRGLTGETVRRGDEEIQAHLEMSQEN